MVAITSEAPPETTVRFMLEFSQIFKKSEALFLNPILELSKIFYKV